MGPCRRTNSPLALVVDADAEDVAREQVARELHAAQLAADGLRERARERGLADARHVLDEEVPAREQRDERELDGVVLALERALDGLAQRLERRELRRDAGRSGHEAQSSTEGLARRNEGIVWTRRQDLRAGLHLHASAWGLKGAGDVRVRG